MSRTAQTKVWKRALTVGCLAVGLVAAGVYAQPDLITRVLASQTESAALPVERPAQPVRVSLIRYTSPAAELRFTGTVRPRHEAELGFRVSGKLLERLVSVGDQVTKGQPIARLDPADAQLDLEAAEADLAAARAELQRAEADVSRSSRMLAAGNVAQAAHDRTSATAAEARGRFDRTQRARDLAANRLDYMELTAETDGVVTRELAEAGQVVAAGQAVVSVARMDGLDVVFALPEHKRDIVTGWRATAELWERKSEHYALALRDVSPDVDPATRTYRVRMGLVAPDTHVTLGRTITVTLTSPGGTPVASLPLAAVINDGDGPAVWRLEPGGQHVERVPIEIDALEGDVARIRGGLAEGDRVVSLGAHKIDPSREVRVVETAAAASN